MNTLKRLKGFTLIELMVTVAIVAILASVALPGYQFAVRSTHRAEAQGCLMELQNFMERFYTLNNSYLCTSVSDPCTESNCICPVVGASPNLPFSKAPTDGNNKAYDLALQANDGNSYTLRATPITGSGQALDGMMELDGTGARRWDKNHNGSFDGTSENTWSR